MLQKWSNGLNTRTDHQRTGLAMENSDPEDSEYFEDEDFDDCGDDHYYAVRVVLNAS